MSKKVCFVSYLLGYAISTCHFSVFILRVSGLFLLLTCSPWDPISIGQSMDEEVFSHISKLSVVSRISAYFSTTVLIYIFIYIYGQRPHQDLPISFFNGFYAIRCFFSKTGKRFAV